MNLYKITNGLGIYYTVAKDYGEAQHNIEDFLDKQDYGFSSHRCVLNIQLIATSDLSDNFETLVIKDK